MRQLAGGDDSGWGLRRQSEVELFQEELVVGVRLGVTAKDQGAAISGGKLNVEHLDSGKLIQDGSRSQPTRHRFEPRPQCDVQAIGHECDKDMGFDPLFELVVNRAQFEIVLQVFECGLNLNQLDVELPKLSRLSAAEIGAQ